MSRTASAVGARAGSWRLTAPAVLITAWGGNHYSPLLLLYREVDGYSAVEVNAFFAFYVLGLVPGFLFAGPLSDRYGRRKLVVAALVLGIVGSVILAAGSATVAWMCVGRLVSGVSVAVAMVAGTSWIKELSQHDADPATRARRASLTLTAGFGLGAGVSGVLAQWGPAPTVLPYALQIALSAAALPWLLRSPETRPTNTHTTKTPATGTPASGTPATGTRGIAPALIRDLRVPRSGRRRFWGVVVPLAPWVFAAPSLAFVVAPALVAAQVRDVRIGFAALLAVITLCVGAGVQPFVPWIGRLTGGRAGVAGLGAIVVGSVVLAVCARMESPGLVVADSVLFGLGYGVCIVCGLVEVQAMADPAALAGLTGIYYSLTYIGFTFPVALAALAAHTSYAVLLAVVAAVCAACALTVAAGLRRPPAHA
ncbi:MFS transporter [Cryptosporangium phraense]|uniref:MFS transporter n=1 Tax=Cryptosporangium phraense TaxID=2593070 RepID=UPI0014793642|nr:MFS transporter [Cryptosporangium phraense]